MAYNKTTWANGDVITAEKLNNIENGIGGCGNFVVNIIYDKSFPDPQDYKYKLDKTYSEIKAAFDAGVAITFRSKDQLGETYYCGTLGQIAEYPGEEYIVQAMLFKNLDTGATEYPMFIAVNDTDTMYEFKG